jgi:hypothetical protein
MERMDYSAPWSAPWGRFLIVTSAFASALLIGVCVLMAWKIREPRALGLAMAALAPAILGGSLLFVVRGYRLDGARLYVRRLLWETVVDLRGLESVERVPSSWMKSIRLFGNGGLFSVSGTFWNRELGRYRAFVTDHANAVVLRISGRTVVVSPGQPEEFVQALVASHPHIRFREGREKEIGR